jgi:hypothetical protein
MTKVGGVAPPLAPWLMVHDSPQPGQQRGLGEQNSQKADNHHPGNPRRVNDALAVGMMSSRTHSLLRQMILRGIGDSRWLMSRGTPHLGSFNKSFDA